MLTENLKAKEKLYQVVEPSYFQNAESLSAEDEQGAIYAFLKDLGTEEYIDWLTEHEDDYYFEIYFAVANEDYTAPAWAVEIEPIK